MSNEKLEIMERMIMAEVRAVIHNQELPLNRLREMVRNCLRDASMDNSINTMDKEYINMYLK